MTFNPVERLTHEFIETSLVYPQTLTGVTSTVGSVAVRLLQKDQLDWDEFMGHQLEGERLEYAIIRTKAAHEGLNVRSDRLGDILPGVYNAMRSSFISSLYELTQGNQGRRLDAVEAVTADQVAAVKDFVLGSSANRATALGLLAQTANVVIASDAAHMMADGYRDALAGLGPEGSIFGSTFVGARTTGEKKAVLAQGMGLLFRADLAREVYARRLSPTELDVFAHNIARP